MNEWDLFSCLAIRWGSGSLWKYRSIFTGQQQKSISMNHVNESGFWFSQFYSIGFYLPSGNWHKNKMTVFLLFCYLFIYSFIYLIWGNKKTVFFPQGIYSEEMLINYVCINFSTIQKKYPFLLDFWSWWDKDKRKHRHTHTYAHTDTGTHTPTWHSAKIDGAIRVQILAETVYILLRSNSIKKKARIPRGAGISSCLLGFL